MGTSVTATGITFPDATTQTTAASSAFPAGTLMLFQQTAAPTGWTKQTTHDNKALRVVSGVASSGGSVAFTTAFASGLSAGNTTLSESQIPSHRHQLADQTGTGGLNYDERYLARGLANTAGSNIWSDYTGGGGSHTHSLPSFQVQYVDIIIARKN